MPFFTMLLYVLNFTKLNSNKLNRSSFEFVTSSSKLKQSYTGDYYLNRIWQLYQSRMNAILGEKINLWKTFTTWLSLIKHFKVIHS